MSIDHHVNNGSPSNPKRVRQVRPSRLDLLDNKSCASNTEFKGLFRMAYTVALVWIFTHPISNYYNNGWYFDPILSSNAFKDFFGLMTAWFLAIICTYIAFGLFLLRQWGVARGAISTMLHTLEVFVAIGAYILVRAKEWAVFPSVFVLTFTIIHLMKIHSYVSTVLEIEDEGIKNFPECCDLKDFTRFVFVPCLVYEVDYPRNDHKFRVGYFIGKAATLVGNIILIFMVASNGVIPVIERAHSQSYLHTFAGLIGPLLVMDLLFFHVMFECILNMLAEITDFGDRDFYQDWWNCTTWDEFARKWNHPVHEFLLRHVYWKIYVSFDKRSKLLASVLTFLVSAILHEFFLTATFGFIGWWMFGLMMIQIPLIMLSKFHKGTSFGNYYFWIGLTIGIPILVVLYGTQISKRWKLTMEAAHLSW